MTPALFAAGMVALCAALCVGAVRAWRAVETRPLRPLEAWVGRLAVAAVMAMPLLADAGALPGPRAPSVGLPLTGGTMTGQVVSTTTGTDVSTENNGTYKIAPAGSGSGVANVQVVSGDTSSSTVDWQDTAFNYSDGSTYGVRMTSNYLDFTNNTYVSWQPGNVRASTITLAVQTLNNAITLTGFTKLGGPFAHYQGTGSFTGTQHNYAACSNYSMCRLEGSSTPVITGMTLSSNAETRMLCNYGTTAIQFNHEDTNSTASNRFDLPGAVNYTLASKTCIFIFWDNVLQRWLKTA